MHERVSEWVCVYVSMCAPHTDQILVFSLPRSVQWWNYEMEKVKKKCVNIEYNRLTAVRMTCHEYTVLFRWTIVQFYYHLSEKFNAISQTTPNYSIWNHSVYQQYHNHLWVSASARVCVLRTAYMRTRMRACTKCKHLYYFCNAYVRFADFRQSSLGQFKSDRWIDWNSTWPKFNIMQSLIIVWNCVNLTANIKMKRKQHRKVEEGKRGSACKMDMRWMLRHGRARSRTPTCNSKSTNNTQ